MRNKLDINSDSISRLGYHAKIPRLDATNLSSIIESCDLSHIY